MQVVSTNPAPAHQFSQDPVASLKEMEETCRRSSQSQRISSLLTLNNERRNKDETKNMSLESILTRELRVRFIDARGLVNEAKAKFGFTGYTSKEHQTQIMEEAIRIFESKPLSVQMNMRRLQQTLECLSATESILNFDGTDSVDMNKSLDVSVLDTATDSTSSSTSLPRRTSIALMKTLFKSHSLPGKKL